MTKEEYEKSLNYVVNGEQQPCDDAISREQVKSDYADWYGYGYRDNAFYKHLCSMPPIISQQKMGRWIMKHRIHNEVKYYTGQDEMGETHTISVLERYEADEPYCSECGKRAGDTSQDYCCACGAKMQETEE